MVTCVIILTNISEVSGLAAGLTPSVSKPALMTPQQFSENCAEIVKNLSGHEAHRALDLLTNQVLSMLGYSEGIDIFEAAVREWHKAGLLYPAPP